MSIVDPEPTPVDVSKFVTYQTEELTTPTEKELLEDLPEWKGREAHEKKVEEKASKPRRGVGFLRAEPEPEEKTNDEAIAPSDFGAGIEDSVEPAKPHSRQSKSRSNRDRQKPDSTPKPAADAPDSRSSESDSTQEESKAPGRKRRRRRGRRNRGEGASKGEPSVPSAESPAANIAAESQASNDSVDKTEPSGEAKKKPRRRRRRGGRNRSNPNTGDGPAAPSTE